MSINMLKNLIAIKGDSKGSIKCDRFILKNDNIYQLKLKAYRSILYIYI